MEEATRSLAGRQKGMIAENQGLGEGLQGFGEGLQGFGEGLQGFGEGLQDPRILIMLSPLLWVMTVIRSINLFLKI